MPTMPDMERCPDLETSWIVILRPPASSNPVARIAPNLAIVSSCLSAMTLCRCLRCSVSLESAPWLQLCIRSIDVASNAPCRTKSTGSSSMGLSKSRPSLIAVPAHETPTAIVAPYRTCGLYDSASSLTTLGVCDGVPASTKPIAVTAARRTSSDTSDTATCSSRRRAAFEPVHAYAKAMVYIAPYLRMGSLSWRRVVTRLSASVSRPYIVIASPSARPRMIFSCAVSCAYPIISSMPLADALPSMTRPIASAAASPATAESLKSTPLSSSYSSSSSVAIAAIPTPSAAPCCTVSFVPALRSASSRYERISAPWLACMMPRA
mmetsp:Transcript_27005/g.61969  ORF Transcript_27005/g.61969 Transcript_27005/m.61969 type:complete len:322 (+) Transcript_27005:328-1293(+)